MKKSSKGAKNKAPLFFMLIIFILYIKSNILWQNIITDIIN